MKLHSVKAFVFFAVLATLGGCGGYGGAIGGAAVSGSLAGGTLGLQLNPPYWPFEEDAEILELDCDGEPTEIAISPMDATLTQTGQTRRFQRDYSDDGDKRLRYFHMTVVDQSYEQLDVNEKSQPDYIVQWLTVPEDLTVALETDDVSVTCKEIGQESK